jgi:alkylation response protein AidB-like acyl-CoA dehydrogenase
MTPTLAPDLHVLGDELLDRLAARDGSAVDESLRELHDTGYLLMAVPLELGGLGGNLAQVCHQQRRLARRAPALARTVNAHLCQTGVAAERRRASDDSVLSLLEAAAAGELLAADDPAAHDSAGVLGMAWGYLTHAAIGAGIGERVLEVTVAWLAQRAPGADGDPRVREMVLELDGASLLLDRMAAEWSAGARHGDRWNTWLAATNHRARATTRRVVDLSLAVTGDAPELSRLARAAVSP